MGWSRAPWDVFFLPKVVVFGVRRGTISASTCTRLLPPGSARAPQGKRPTRAPQCLLIPLPFPHARAGVQCRARPKPHKARQAPKSRRFCLLSLPPSKETPLQPGAASRCAPRPRGVAERCKHHPSRGRAAPGGRIPAREGPLFKAPRALFSAGAFLCSHLREATSSADSFTRARVSSTDSDS